MVDAFLLDNYMHEHKSNSASIVYLSIYFEKFDLWLYNLYMYLRAKVSV